MGWQSHLMGKVSPKIESYAQNAPIPALFLFCSTNGSTFTQDGTRKEGKHRLEMEQELYKRCLATGAKMIIVEGEDWDHRNSLAVEAINSVIGHTEEKEIEM